MTVDNLRGTWITSEYQVGCADTDNCQAPDCTRTAVARFVTIGIDIEGKPRRSKAFCEPHAVEMRKKIAGGTNEAPIPPHPKPAPDPLPPAAVLPTPSVPPTARRQVKFPIPPNSASGICKACRKPIVWIQPKKSPMPVDPDGTPHWATCSDPDRFRNPR